MRRNCRIARAACRDERKHGAFRVMMIRTATLAATVRDLLLIPVLSRVLSYRGDVLDVGALVRLSLRIPGLYGSLCRGYRAVAY